MKVALITGAGARIGRAIAEHFLDLGYGLILHANNSLPALVSWVKAHPQKNNVLKIIGADISLSSGQEKLIDEAQSASRSIDLLVHNASDFKSLSFESITRVDYQKMMAINLEAPFFITQKLLPNLRSSTNPLVVNIIDSMWERPCVRYSHYSAAKAGLAILTRSLAQELAPDIRVNGVAPGAILFAKDHDEKAKINILGRIPFKRLGDVQDIALTIEFLAERSPYISGQIISVDGARSIAS